MVELAAVAGFQSGSLSFARIMMRRVAPGREVQRNRRAVPGTEGYFEGHSVSANSIPVQLALRYRCLTAIWDASKAPLPALVLRVLSLEEPYYLIAATTGIVGHI